MEFDAVVLAAGSGQRMTDLTNCIPKPLLPVANKPLIFYPLMLLKRAGFEEVYITVLKSQHDEIDLALQTYYHVGLKRVHLLDVPDGVDWGTADTLRHHQAKFKYDIVAVSCDLICDVSLHHVFDLHRTENGDVTILLASSQAQLATPKSLPGPKAKKKPERDIIGLSSDSRTRLLYLASEVDFNDEIEFPTAIMKNFPRVDLSSRLLDAHLYVINRRALSYLSDHSSLLTLKSELLPRLVRRQHRIIEPIEKSHDSTNETSMEQLARELSCGVEVNSERDMITCWAYVMRDGLCSRVNTVSAYCEANRQACRLYEIFGREDDKDKKGGKIAEKSVVSRDCCVADGVQIAERTTLKSSVVASDCVLSEKCKVTGSVLMTAVQLDQGCHVSGSVICAHAHIEENVELKDCIVTARYTVPANSKFSNEIVGDSGFEMEM